MDARKAAYAVLLVLLVAGIVLSPLGALSARAQTPPAFPISVSPTTASPGQQVLVQGEWSSKTEGVSLRWDSVEGRQIGSVRPEDIGREDAFAVQATIPPNASPGAHKIIAYDAGLQLLSEADITVQGSALQAAYIHGADEKTTADYLAFLSARAQLSVQAIPVGQVAGADVSPFSLIIIGPDSGNMDTWGTAEARKAIAASGIPVLALGGGGSSFFGGMRLRTGWPNGVPVNTQAVAEGEGGQELFSHPYFLADMPDGTLLFPTDQPAVAIYSPKPLPGMLRVGQVPDDPAYFNIVQEKGRYLFWGYETPPTIEGLRVYSDELMVNAIWYLLQLRLNAGHPHPGGLPADAGHRLHGGRRDRAAGAHHLAGGLAQEQQQHDRHRAPAQRGPAGGRPQRPHHMGCG